MTATSIAEVPLTRRDIPPMIVGNDCGECATRRICIWSHLDPPNHDRLDGLGRVTRKVHAGEAIFRAGDAFRNLYVARAGSSKTVFMREDGRHQITGFQLAGEFLGLDAIASGVHQTDAIALENSVVCALPYAELERLADSLREVRDYLNQAMSEEITREAGLLMLMGNLSAEERVAAFLVNLSDRYAMRGYSPPGVQPAHEPRRDRLLPGHETGNREPHAGAPARARADRPAGPPDPDPGPARPAGCLSQGLSTLTGAPHRPVIGRQAGRAGRRVRAWFRTRPAHDGERG